MSIIEVAIGYARDPGRFRVQVVDSPVGHASADVDLDVEGLLASRARFEQALLLSGVAVRRNLTAEEKLIQDTGKSLFAALLGAGEVGGRYRATAAVADERGEDLRIVLRIDAPELAALPWEAMYDEGAGNYVCRQHQLVRHVPVAAAPSRLTVQPPLRILAVVAAPRDRPPLDTRRERGQLARALGEPIRTGLVGVTWASSATWAGIHEQLMAGQWHVIHFIGHDDFNSERDEGRLALVGEDELSDDVEASRLADLLRQARPMPRLVVLNSCQGATMSTGDLFSGTAAALTRGGVAAVAAMQYSISDPAAIAFTRGFYTALGHGRGVDDAVSAGRIAILGTSGETLEWLTPVLYLRGGESRLFEVKSPPGQSGSPSEEPRGPAATTSGALPQQRFRLQHTLVGHRRDLAQLEFSPDRVLVATASEDWTARLWDTATGATVRVLSGHQGPVSLVAFSPGGDRLATMSQDGTTRVWDVATGASIHVLANQERGDGGGKERKYRFEPGLLTFISDGALAATSVEHRSVSVWDVASGQVARTFYPSSAIARAWQDLFGYGGPDLSAGALFTRDGTLVATSDQKRVRLRDVATGEPVRAFRHDAYRYRTVSLVAFSPDGSLLAVRDAGYGGRLYDVATGRRVRAFNDEGTLVFSPEGTVAAVTGSDGVVRLWDTRTWQCRHTLVGDAAHVGPPAFSQDGARLVTRGSGTAMVWDVATGECVGELTGYPDAAAVAAWHPDGYLLVAAMQGKAGRIWTAGSS